MESYRDATPFECLENYADTLCDAVKKGYLTIEEADLAMAVCVEGLFGKEIALIDVRQESLPFEGGEWPSY